MAFQWRYEDESGGVVDDPATPAAEAFPSQADAETWLGETWRELLHSGVAQVTLLDGDRVVYGPMGLDSGL
jgi:hypothetical protein